MIYQLLTKENYQRNALHEKAPHFPFILMEYVIMLYKITFDIHNLKVKKVATDASPTRTITTTNQNG